MYPEASYSFDGTQTPLPESLAKCMKLLKVPVVMIRTEGAFLRDPLYNCLQKRKVKVSAEVSCLFSAEEIQEKSVDELADHEIHSVIDKIADKGLSTMMGLLQQTQNVPEIIGITKENGAYEDLYNFKK